MKQSVKILIIVLSLIIVGLVTFIITDAVIKNSRKDSDETIVIENKSENNSSKQEAANVTENTTVDENDVPNTNQTTETQKKDTDTTNNNSEAVEAIKKALKDDEWVKENVMMKESCFIDVPVEHEQELTFMILKSNNNIPMIAVCAYSEEDISNQIFIVTYKNGKVVSNSITEHAMHNSHAGIEIDPNNYIAIQGYGHMGYMYNTYYDIKSGTSTYLDGAGYELGNTDETYEVPQKYYKGKEQTECSESEYNEIISKYSKYKFYSIDTELTDSNIDNYIK